MNVNMSPAEANKVPTQVIYDNGSYKIESCYIPQCYHVATLTFFLDANDGSRVTSGENFNELRRLADTLAQCDAALAA